MPMTTHERERQPVRRRLLDQVLVVGFVLFTCLSLLILYTVAHELGHALVGLAFGQTLTAFDVRLWNLNHRGTSRATVDWPAQPAQPARQPRRAYSHGCDCRTGEPGQPHRNVVRAASYCDSARR